MPLVPSPLVLIVGIATVAHASATAGAWLLFSAALTLVAVFGLAGTLFCFRLKMASTVGTFIRLSTKTADS